MKSDKKQDGRLERLDEAEANDRDAQLTRREMLHQCYSSAVAKLLLGAAAVTTLATPTAGCYEDYYDYYSNYSDDYSDYAPEYYGDSSYYNYPDYSDSYFNYVDG
jgi:hypothetical protein